MSDNLIFESRKLSYMEILPLLRQVDNEFTPPFFEHLNMEEYARKLENFGHFIIARCGEDLAGVLVYYKNDKEKYLYIPMIVCISRFTRQGISHRMLIQLQESNKNYHSIRLQVLKSNEGAISFYQKGGFSITEAADCSRFDCIKNL